MVEPIVCLEVRSSFIPGRLSVGSRYSFSFFLYLTSISLSCPVLIYLYLIWCQLSFTFITSVISLTKLAPKSCPIPTIYSCPFLCPYFLIEFLFVSLSNTFLESSTGFFLMITFSLSLSFALVNSHSWCCRHLCNSMTSSFETAHSIHLKKLAVL